ncbi:hypothetical protein E4U43_003049 [Claviceps pusilla]|uniref:SprT-like domain-containing protein n=1 Tax=Claviceps pusilla TaxID=123648 RepID=A0A9P7N5P0_9HYPO|nr:hypothetical protein E4U43_003049 [Claviceps pusilla]
MAFWVVAGGAGGEPLHALEAAPRHRDAGNAGDPGDPGDAGDIGYFNLQDRATSRHWHHGGRGHAQYDHECEGRTEQRREQQHRQHHRPPHHDPESVPVRNLAFLVIREGDDGDRDCDHTHTHVHVHAHDHNPDHDHNHSRPYPHSRAHTSDYRHSPSPSPSPSLEPYLPGESSPAIRSPRNLSIPATLERTESGHSISSNCSPHHNHHSPLISDSSLLLEDLEAARLVRDHVALYRRRYPDSQPERILRALISPKSRGAEFPLDNDALQSIFSAANELFFASRLTRRVTWDWSHSASSKYENHILGTTAVRKSTHSDGLETLIVLSSPILRDTKYNRRLIISTFLHEMMHSFMFVACGWNSKQSSGHTQGFLQIAGVIDDWAGKDCLHLREMEANLERWRGNDYTVVGGVGTSTGPAGKDSHHDIYIHKPMEPSLELSRYNDPLYLEQATGSWDKRHISSEHEPHLLLSQPLPQQRCASQEEWQWYERGDFGERLQYVALTQYGP